MPVWASRTHTDLMTPLTATLDDDGPNDGRGARLILRLGFGGADAVGQHQIAEMGRLPRNRHVGSREGQDIGRPVPVTEAGVEIAHALVIRQQHDDVAFDLAKRRAGGSFDTRGGVRQGDGPGRVLDLDLDHASGSSRSAAGRRLAASAS